MELVMTHLMAHLMAHARTGWVTHRPLLPAQLAAA
jgi:hypothetical protein